MRAVVMTKHTIVTGDARDLSTLGDESVHLVITSPPYWQLKDYGVEGQIGYHDSYENYVNNLNLAWMECIRVLHPGCRMCINIGDQFARSVYYGRYKVIPIRTEIIKFCESAGLDYMGAIIWQKVTTCNTTGGATVMGSFPHPRNGIVKLDYEFILLFKKLGKAPHASREQKAASQMSTEEWNRFFTGHWTFPGVKNDRHLAPFPEELPTRLIRMFSFPGETVLDPFLGSGTTSVAALHLKRNSIGYEINAGYARKACQRLADARGLLEAESDVELIEAASVNEDQEKRIERLPYRFKDAVPFTRKVNPKQLRFGSKIDGTEQKRRFYRVREILSPDEVMLDSGLHVRLIGVLPKPGKESEAMKFLAEATKGQQVLLKFDTECPAENGVVCGYLYLKNRTFLNAHLLKRGLADADTSHDYRCKTRFLSLGRRSK